MLSPVYPVRPYHKSVTLKITNCQQCPHCDTQRTVGAGCADDYVCKLLRRRVIAGYVEYSSEEPQDNQIPNWCPLAKKKKGVA
jgi:hypothetical protein